MPRRSILSAAERASLLALPDTTVPASLLQWIGRQLRIAPGCWPQYAKREETRREHLSPLGWEHINLTGDYLWRNQRQARRGKIQAATTGPTGLAYDFFPFSERTPGAATVRSSPAAIATGVGSTNRTRLEKVKFLPLPFRASSNPSGRFETEYQKTEMPAFGFSLIFPRPRLKASLSTSPIKSRILPVSGQVLSQHDSMWHTLVDEEQCWLEAGPCIDAFQ